MAVTRTRQHSSHVLSQVNWKTARNVGSAKVEDNNDRIMFLPPAPPSGDWNPVSQSDGEGENAMETGEMRLEKLQVVIDEPMRIKPDSLYFWRNENCKNTAYS